MTGRTGLTRVIPTRWAVDDGIVDPAGLSVIYTTRLGPNSPSRLTVINVQSGGETELSTGFNIGNPQITADVSTVFFTDVAGGVLQLFSIGIGGSNRRQITTGSEGPVGYRLRQRTGRIRRYSIFTAAAH